MPYHNLTCELPFVEQDLAHVFVDRTVIDPEVGNEVPVVWTNGTEVTHGFHDDQVTAGAGDNPNFTYVAGEDAVPFALGYHGLGTLPGRALVDEDLKQWESWAQQVAPQGPVGTTFKDEDAYYLAKLERLGSERVNPVGLSMAGIIRMRMAARVGDRELLVPTLQIEQRRLAVTRVGAAELPRLLASKLTGRN